jgi:transcriptional regulator with XRE-family HTH domain
MENNFNDWVMSEMEKRNWSFADLSKKSGISQAHISKVFSGQRGIGNDFLNAISIALGYPPEYIFRKAGILPPLPETTEQHQELTYLFDKFPEDEQKDLLSYMRIKLEMLEREGKIKNTSK